MNASGKPKTDISKYIKGRAAIVGIGNTLKGVERNFFFLATRYFLYFTIL